jgi:multisubunit Na+/H+ antiporter MnhG subunit
VSSVAIDALLAAGVAAQLLACTGLAVMRTAADRLHYASAGYTVGPLCILAAVLVREHASTSAWQAVAAVLVLVLAGPIVVHATARLIRRVDQEDVVPSEEASR